MPVDPKLDELIDRWEDLHRQGREVSAEELCRDHPELLEELKRRIKALEAMAWLEESDSSGDADEQPEADKSLKQLPPTLGRYRLDELVGVGGFGQVWRGYDPELQRVVAIKVPRPGGVSPQQITVFLDEARKVAQLKHPGIVPVHDVGQDGEYCFIVSDYVDGGSLADRMKTSPLDWRESSRIVIEIAEILAHAHRQGFIHRDIKPANILLDRQGKTYLTDFGIAISSEDRSIGTASVLGTRAYMSPEQVRGTLAEIDARTDIYSLGVVLYQLLSGHLPFESRDGFDLRQAILSETPRLEPLGQDIPPALEHICQRAMEKNAANRYLTADEFAAELKKATTPQYNMLRPWQLIVVSVCLLIVAVVVVRAWRVKEQAAPRPEPEKVIEAIKDYAKLHPPPPIDDRALKDALKTLRSVQSEFKKELGGIPSLPRDSPQDER